MPTPYPDPAPSADHGDAEHVFTDAGWTRLGAGDWAIALLSPDGQAVARISPFDPTGPYTAELYLRTEHTLLVPRLYAHRRLTGGGDLMVMERLHPVDPSDAAGLHRLLLEEDESVAELTRIVRAIHERALAELPWCGPIDENPSNVMRGSDGRLVLIDPFYADGPALYATAASDPDAVVTGIPEAERRFMTEIPLAESGPWEPADRETMRLGLAAADARHRLARASTLDADEGGR
ncbi:hypothetical protein [Microbacterium hibisci]|uniref:hypothetical protein n=1 Tax=Microbacterium hibisci TaxID=2036000 RepID=UPI0019448F79|nr:hypothetical protein [Microbacterium hibisci]